METAIGAVLHGNTLTIVVRQADSLGEPIQHPIPNSLAAVGLLLDLKVEHRHDDPPIFLEANSVAGPVLDEIRQRDKRSRDQIINGLSPALSSAGAGVLFYDRRSELHFRFRERVAAGRLLVPDIFHEQLAAFTSSEQTKDGKVFFPYTDDVAAKLGRYPALAVAAVLAAIDAPPRVDAQPGDYDPLANLRNERA
jgi:hypothetical protein